MNPHRLRTASVIRFLIPMLLGVGALSAQVTSTTAPDLSGTSWQLVQFRGGDDTILTPDDKSKYTIAFGNDGRASVRIDCNRGSGTWRTTGRSRLELGPLALTRMMCPPGSLHDRIARHWSSIRSYVIRDGRLFLSLMADGGIYEFEPVGSAGTVARAVQGTATYRERIAMPANAVFEATLEDVSRVGARAEVVARVRNEQPGNPPIPFTIAFDAARINASRRYAVRARILSGERLFFTTDQLYPVLTAGRGNTVQLLLRRTTGPGSPITSGPIASQAPLEDTYWKLTNIGSTPVTAASRQQEPHFILRPGTRTVSGSGGCNRLSGTYDLNGDRLSFSRLLGTMMACIQGMETERAFHRAMEHARRWKIDGQQLELFDASGRRVARFEAVYTD